MDLCGALGLAAVLVALLAGLGRGDAVLVHIVPEVAVWTVEDGRGEGVARAVYEGRAVLAVLEAASREEGVAEVDIVDATGACRNAVIS